MKSKEKVLIVEDELIAAESLKAFLQDNGYDVVGITDRGNNAVELAKSLDPSIIFMDIMLKDGLSGSEAALKISRFSQAIIIFITAYSDNEMIDYATQSHAAAYLVKPYNRPQILATLRMVLSSHRTTADTYSLALIDDYFFSFDEEELYRNGERVKIGPRAKVLLTLLCHAKGTAVSNQQICLQIWGKEVDTSILRALIYRTRTATCEALIENVNTRGYKIALRT